MSGLDRLILWLLVGGLVAIVIIRAIYVVKVDGKALDLRLTTIRILIILGVVAAIVMGFWTVPHGQP